MGSRNRTRDMIMRRMQNSIGLNRRAQAYLADLMEATKHQGEWWTEKCLSAIIAYRIAEREVAELLHALKHGAPETKAEKDGD